MSEQQALYCTQRWEDLDIEERTLILTTLSFLTPQQVFQIGKKIFDICRTPGFGRVYITIENDHPLLIGTDITEKLEPK